MSKDAEKPEETSELKFSNPLMMKMYQAYNTSKKAIMHGTSVDVHEVVEEDELVAALHANAEVFEPRVEFTFSYLQVSSA